MRAVITVVGRDSIGIIASVASECAKYSVNISDITQSVLDEVFCYDYDCRYIAYDDRFYKLCRRYGAI